MAPTDTRVVTAHVPISLAEKVDQMAARLERSRGWIIKQALSAWIEQEEERTRLTREALADVDAGHVIDHQAVQAWADILGGDEPLPLPRSCMCGGQAGDCPTWPGCTNSWPLQTRRLPPGRCSR